MELYLLRRLSSCLGSADRRLWDRTGIVVVTECPVDVPGGEDKVLDISSDRI